jgi:limonene-1,2-epoxide hydrolase
VTVLIRDVPAEDYFRGGTARRPAPASPDPTEIVRAFLAAMEARDLERAQRMLAQGFTMTFPGTAPMTSLDALIDWARSRYTFVEKAYEGFDAMPSSGAAMIVYCRGTLRGEWPDGTPFDGIRFIDRFEIVEGRITRQEVWNDIGEARP